jgi:diadenosine tetraphosphate (Ap4A) HIT family hydrolase
LRFSGEGTGIVKAERRECEMCALLATPELTVHDGEHVVIAMPRRTRSAGNLLIIPRVHVSSVCDLPLAVARELVTGASRAALMCADLVAPDGINTWLDAGDITGDNHPHIVFEVVPRHAGQVYKFLPRAQLPVLLPGEICALIQDIGRRDHRTGETVVPGAHCDACEAVNGLDPDGLWVEVTRKEGTVTFITDRQRSPGSLLVLPERHVRWVGELTPAEGSALAEAIWGAVGALGEAFKPGGWHIWTGTGPVAGQSMSHMHFQVVPRYAGVRYTFAPSGQLPVTDLAERQHQAACVRSSLGFDRSLR